MAWFTLLTSLCLYVVYVASVNETTPNTTKGVFISLEVPMEKRKKDCCLFDMLFKIKKNSVFYFGISFFVLEILTL